MTINGKDSPDTSKGKPTKIDEEAVRQACYRIANDLLGDVNYKCGGNEDAALGLLAQTIGLSAIRNNANIDALMDVIRRDIEELVLMGEGE